MQTIFFETSKEDQEKYRKLMPENNITFYEEKLTLENISLAKEADIISIFINSEIKKEILDALPTLKHIVTRSTGTDHIDKNYCQEKNISVSNVPAYGSVTVAEFTFGLILNLSRNIFKATDQIKQTNHFNIFNLKGFDLKGKTIGVVGTGRIGKNVIKIANGFDMNVVAYDLYKDEKYAEENNFKYVTFEDIISKSDIITLHTPYTKENHHLINNDVISKMKKGVYIINTARGELIDTSALLEGIQNGTIKGVGLDVLEGERMLKEEFEITKNGNIHTVDYKTLLEDHILINIPEVIITPHIAFYSEEAESEIIHTTVKNITDFENGSTENLIK